MRAPENWRSHKHLLPAAYLAATAMLLLSSYSDAAEWRVIRRTNLVETYSDNVRLGGGAGTDDFITQTNPGITVTGIGNRFNANIDYTLNNLIYANNSNFNRIRHQLNAIGTAELVKDLFFVDGSASIRQQNTSLLGPQGIDNVNVTGNRSNVSLYSVSPYLRHRFQNFASTELRYIHNIVNSSANSLFNSQGDSFLLGLNSGTAFNTLGWGVNYSNQMIHFATGRSVELERTIGNLRYRVTPQFGLTATGGYERNSFISIRGSPSAPLWTVGFAWAPTERTNIAVNGGQRFFGNTYSALASHRTRLTAWDVSYSQDITTFNQQAGLGLGSSAGFGGSLNQLLAAQNPTLSPDAIQQASGAILGLGATGSFFGPTNFLTNRLFLQKMLQASVAMNGARNTVVLRVFDMTRQAFSPDSVDAGLVGAGDLALLNHTRQRGANALWSYRLSQLTSANANFGYTKFSFLGAGRVDDFWLITLGLSRQFSQIRPNLNGTLQVRHQERNSNQPGADYRENAIIASLNMSF
ncbi:TIGR03016 family PEP-CTERM system-associated outer membrane protein [Nitrosovibrio tenuis]|uniref:Uncharacterized protein, PEP-CTERM system associated n=1 Tax=Nitrosovibrio tenuis TaxID=1233 RepID=A0A1H7FVX0_9PROT|nr:TIGR03016 family PEP-CTERM system-associated outer membrane protein [Nitrosovibrio tenuis]SEK30061.1 uncharacterized protein, PEP-CTERM system associated [Nitrosovibrio tenuis]